MTATSSTANRRASLLRRGVAVAVLIGFAALITSWWTDRNDTTKVGAADAAALVGASQRPPTIDPGLRPTAGTYSYGGSGWDSFSFGSGSKHTFPDEVNVVVEYSKDGCAWTSHIVFIKEHVEKRTFCTSQVGVKDTGFSRTTTTLGREQTSTYKCTDGAWRSPTATAVGETWAYTCTERRGGVVRYVGERMPDTKLAIGGEKTSVRHLRVRGTQRGKHVGDELSEYWLLETGLPARFASTRSLRVSTPMGDMTSRESYTYTLAASEPETI